MMKLLLCCLKSVWLNWVPSLKGVWQLVCLTPLVLSLSTIKAGPWIEPGDIWLRSDIEYLANHGIIKAPITTWPIMWSTIKRDLDYSLHGQRFSKYTDQEQLVLLRIKRAFRGATHRSTSATFRLSSDPEVIRGFADKPKEKREVELSSSSMGDIWAFKLNIQYINQPYTADLQKRDTARFDGSYISGVFGNYSLSVGYIDKWWGPGWDSSVILSTNARPRPGMMIQRNYADAFETKWLSWIGPWTMNAFVNVLDDERSINNAKLLGMSVSFKPLDSLEIGLRRTAQWGGSGRSQSLSNLIDLALGKDNCGDRPDKPCGENFILEPGNQLASVDARWMLPFEKPMSIYFQLMGEDEAGYFPSKKTYIFGFNSNVQLEDYSIQYFLEYTDTSIEFGKLYNVAYNHHIYTTGYRYYGRSLASTYDNDSTALVLGASVALSKNQKLFVQFKNADINVDDAGKHSISTSNVSFTELSGIYRHQLKQGVLEVSLEQYSDLFDEYGRQKRETRASASWKMNY